MYAIVLGILALVLVDAVRHRRRGTPSASVAARVVRRRLAPLAGAVVLVVALAGNLAVSGSWDLSLPLALLLGLVVSLLVGVTTGGSGPLGRRVRRR